MPRKLITSLLLLLFLFPWTPAQARPEGQTTPKIASYTISAQLDDVQRTITGQETITYQNAASKPITELVFHLYLNAFKSEETIFMKEGGGQSRGYKFDAESNGWIEVQSIRVKDGPALKLALLEDGTLAKADLPKAVNPGESVALEVAFKAKLPYVFSRTGWALDAKGDPFFLVGQWFPKLGVWTDQGWNAYPFHNNAEFFADFGDYDVTMTLPAGYVTGAVGVMEGAPENSGAKQIIHYRAENVLDFAWTASKNFRSASKTAQLSSGPVEVTYLYLPEHDWSVNQALASAVASVQDFSKWYGLYPYPRLTVVDVPDEGMGAGGMEYPSFITTETDFSGMPKNLRDYYVRMVTVHEVAHQWWQSVVATNEAEEPWLDEGFADYSASRWLIAQNPLDPKQLAEGKISDPSTERRRQRYLSHPNIPMYGTAWDFPSNLYSIATYGKPNLALLSLERTLSEPVMLKILSTYFDHYRFGHPTTQDFRAVAEEVSGQNLSWFFGDPAKKTGLVYGEGVVDYRAKKAEAQSVTVDRVGDVPAPVDVQVDFTDGTAQMVTWNGQETSHTFTFNNGSPVKDFKIDPGHKLLIETRWDNNVLETKAASAVPQPALPSPTPAPTALPALPEAPPPTAPTNGKAPKIGSYAIDVRLDPEKRQIQGRETITYHNATQTAIPDLAFHLYLNAFKNSDTIFMKEGSGQSRGYLFNASENGWIEVDSIKIKNGADLKLEPVEDGTLAKASLPQPVAPGQEIVLEVSFHAQLPHVFARTGWALDKENQPFFMVAQWFPKLGVWTDQGWNAYPFHANSEFFADYGMYDVNVTVPQNYKTGGVGLPTGTVQNGDGTQTVSYHAENVIEFAWLASPSIQTASRKVGNTEIMYIYLPEHAWSVQRALDASEAALTNFSKWFGQYPYARLSVVDVPDSGQGAGGMEYPTLVTAGAMSLTGLSGPWAQSGSERSIELVTVHEIGHQWWMGLVGFNEAEEPWLDEGFTDYSSVRLMQSLYGDSSALNAAGVQISYLDMRRFEYIADPSVPMYGKAWDFGGTDYGVAAYSKPALSLLSLERTLGQDTMLKVMSTFFQRYEYGHPKTEDFRRTAEEVSGQDLSWFFGDRTKRTGLVYGSGTVNYAAQSIDGRTITVRRTGRLALPVDIAVTYTDGSGYGFHWDGQSAAPQGTLSTQKQIEGGIEQQFQLEKPVQSFEIDPQHKLPVELIWSDNGLSRQADIPSWLAVMARMLYQLQDWLIGLGGI